MALHLKRTVGTAVVFQVNERMVKLKLDRIEGQEVLFSLIINGHFNRARRNADSVLNFQVGGELVSVYVHELYGNTAVLRITASPAVHIIRQELTVVPG